MHFKQKHMDCNYKIWDHHASTFGIIYSNGGHIIFNYTHTSLKSFLKSLVQTTIKFALQLLYVNAHKLSSVILNVHYFSQNST